MRACVCVRVRVCVCVCVWSALIIHPCNPVTTHTCNERVLIIPTTRYLTINSCMKREEENRSTHMQKDNKNTT